MFRLQALELKAQNGTLAGIKSEVNRLEDALEECAVYRVFLDGLTPPEWLQVNYLYSFNHSLA